MMKQKWKIIQNIIGIKPRIRKVSTYCSI